MDKVSREISKKRKWDSAKWNADAGRAEGKTENVRSLNSYLDLLLRKVYEVRQQLLHHGHPVTAKNIKTNGFKPLTGIPLPFCNGNTR
jgi:hypothetical protein